MNDKAAGENANHDNEKQPTSGEREIFTLTPTKAEHPIEETLGRLLSDMDNIQNAAIVALPHAFEWKKREVIKTSKNLLKFDRTSEGRTTTFTSKEPADAVRMVALARKLEELHEKDVVRVLLESLFTQIFAELDSFSGRLLRAIYQGRSELLKSIEKQINLSDLLTYSSLADLQNDILNDEIDTFRRDSYVQQFISLEKKFGISLRDFPEWPEFVELTQRRNLLIHNGGIVSDQYLTICRKEECKWDKEPAIGARVGVNGEYLVRAIFLVSKVGFMLAHTLWRKIFPEQAAAAHEAANNALYRLLLNKRWASAAEFGSFALLSPMKKGLNEVDLRVRIINTAIGLKFKKNADTQQVERILNSIDWSACHRDFRLAVAVLKDDFESAAKLMHSIGKTGEMIDEYSYHEWPLFHMFRGTEEFGLAYEKIYEKKFAVTVKTIQEESIQVDGHVKRPHTRSPRKIVSEPSQKEITPKVSRAKASQGKAEAPGKRVSSKARSSG